MKCTPQALLVPLTSQTFALFSRRLLQEIPPLLVVDQHIFWRSDPIYSFNMFCYGSKGNSYLTSITSTKRISFVYYCVTATILLLLLVSPLGLCQGQGMWNISQCFYILVFCMDFNSCCLARSEICRNVSLDRWYLFIFEKIQEIACFGYYDHGPINI